MPITRVVYERYAFTAEDSYLTASVLVAYAIGMFVYLGRDVLVRVFYAMGDGDTPVSDQHLQYFSECAAGLFPGEAVWCAPGLVLATVGVNFVSDADAAVVSRSQAERATAESNGVCRSPGWR